MNWAGFFPGTDQPGWPARVDLPLVLSRRTLRIGHRKLPCES